MELSQKELEQLTKEVLESIRSNSRTINELTPVSEVSITDRFEINGGRSVSYATIKKQILTVFGDMSEQDITEIFRKLKNKEYLSRVSDDIAEGFVSFLAGFLVGDYVKDKSGACINKYGFAELAELVVRGLADLRGDANISGNTTIGKNQRVKGNLDVDGNADIDGKVGIGGDTVIGGDVEIGGDTEIGGGVEIGGNADIEGDTEIGGDTNIKGSIDVGGDAEIEGDSVFGGRLSSKEFISGFIGGLGWALTKDIVTDAGGRERVVYSLELDNLTVRNTMRIFEMVVSQLVGENDNRVFTSMLEVDHYDPKTGKIYLNTQNGKFYNPFRVDDYIEVRQYNGMPSEDNAYYVTKGYDFIVTEVGIGDLADGENRLDWIKFRNFTAMSEGTPETFITKGDSIVRMDNESDPDRKGIIQIVTVGSKTPYIDIIRGLKTDEDYLKGRLGNLEGIRHHLFGWLQGFGAYLANLYAVGDFRISRTGDSVDTQIQILKERFSSIYSEVVSDVTDADNYLYNPTFTENMDGWEVVSRDVRLIKSGGVPMLMNGSIFANSSRNASLSSYQDQKMLHILNSGVRQRNELIRKPEEYTAYKADPAEVTEWNAEISPEIESGGTKEKDTLYLSIKFLAKSDGQLTIGFKGSEGGADSLPHPSIIDVEASEQWQTLTWSGTWDGKGDFVLEYTGEMYVEKLSLTSDPLSDYKKEVGTRFEQTARNILLLGYNIDAKAGQITQLGLDINALDGYIRAYVEVTDAELENIKGTELKLSEDLAELKAYSEEHISSIEGDVDSIQTDILEIKEAGLKISDDVAELYAWKETVDQTTGEHTELISSLQVRAGQIESNVTELENGIEQANSRITQTAEEIRSEVKAVSEDLEETRSSFSQTAEEIRSEVIGVKSEVENVKGDINDINGDIVEVNKIIEETQSSITQTAEQIMSEVSSVRTEVSGVKEDVNGIKEDLDEINISIEETKSSITQTASEIRSEVSSVRTEINSVKDNVNDINGDISDLKDDVNDIKDDVDVVKKDVIEAKSSITQTASEILSEVSEVQKSIEVVQGDLDDVKGDLGVVKEDIKETKSSISQTASEIRAEVKEVSDDVETLSSTITQTAKDIRAEIKDSEDGLQSQINQNASSISSLVGDFSGFKSQTSGDIDDIRKQASDILDQLELLDIPDVSGVISDVNRLISEVGDINGSIDNLTSGLGSLSSNVDGLSSQVGDLNNEVDGLNSELDGLNGDVDGLNSQVGTINGQMQGVLNDIEKLKNSLGDLIESDIPFHVTWSERNQEIDSIKDSVTGIEAWQDETGSTILEIQGVVLKLEEDTAQIIASYVKSDDLSLLVKEAGFYTTNEAAGLIAMLEELDTQTGELNASVSSIQATVNGFSATYVKQGETIADINASDDGLKISAKKISLEGYATLNGALTVEEDGDINLYGRVRFLADYVDISANRNKADAACIVNIRPYSTSQQIGLGSRSDYVGMTFKIFNENPIGGVSHTIRCPYFQFNETTGEFRVWSSDYYTLAPQESMEVTCFLMADHNAKWIVTSRMSKAEVNKDSALGLSPICVAMGSLTNYVSSKTASLTGRLANGKSLSSVMSVQRSDMGRYIISFTNGTLPTGYKVFTQPTRIYDTKNGNTVSDTNVSGAGITVAEKTATSITFYCSDDASLNDVDFDFMIYAFDEWANS